jgi:hypothetical protein
VVVFALLIVGVYVVQANCLQTASMSLPDKMYVEHIPCPMKIRATEMDLSEQIEHLKCRQKVVRKARVVGLQVLISCEILQSR